MAIRSRVLHTSKSLTAGTEQNIGTILVPSTVKKLIGVAVQSEGGGYVRLQASSLGDDVYAPAPGWVLTTSGAGNQKAEFTPLDNPIQAGDTINVFRTSGLATSSKYETITCFFSE